MVIFARYSDRSAPCLADCGHDLFIYAAGQYHLDDLHRHFVGDPMAVDKLTPDSESFEHGADLWSPAMDDNWIDTHLAQQHYVAGEQPRQIWVYHRMAAVFDDDGATCVAPHVW